MTIDTSGEERQSESWLAADHPCRGAEADVLEVTVSQGITTLTAVALTTRMTVLEVLSLRIYVPTMRCRDMN